VIAVGTALFSPGNDAGSVSLGLAIPGPTDDHGITAGSLLLNVERQPVASPAEVQRRIDAARDEQRDFVLLLIQEPSGLRWVSLPLKATGAGAPPSSR
jgi:hypothetical protein